jgi:hypothetical protein
MSVVCGFWLAGDTDVVRWFAIGRRQPEQIAVDSSAERSRPALDMRLRLLCRHAASGGESTCDASRSERGQAQALSVTRVAAGEEDCPEGIVA